MIKIFSNFSIINKKIFYRFLIILGIVILVFLIGISSYYVSYTSKIYPNISVASINIGGKSLESASTILTEKINTIGEIKLIYNDRDFTIKLNDFSFSNNIPQSVENAYNFTRSGKFFYDLQSRIRLLFKKQDFDLSVTINDEELRNSILPIAKSITIKPIEPSISVNGEEITVNKGKPGVVLDEYKLIELVKEYLVRNKTGVIEIPAKNVGRTLTESQASLYEERARELLGKGLNIKFEYNTFNFGASELIQLVDPVSNYKDSSVDGFIENLASSIERSPQEPKFTFENGKVTEFQPALDGIKIDNEEFKKKIIESLDTLAQSQDKTVDIEVPVIKITSDISTDDVNDFGIKELIGRGTSTYFHSISSRVHNVSLAASKINGTLVKPGETFSFNQTLGEVSGTTGYQQAYIISEGRTILGDGGGVCQVSTTLFRALLDAGLPIIERQSHAYRVIYYEQDSPPGLDATVYSPSPDLKFTNDTPGYILIVAKANPKNYSLVFELYGTSDGRISNISKPLVTGVTAPPPDLYQDDPTLPAGTIKQIDWKAWGAKVTFNYSVTRNGEKLINKTFISNYKSWQAIFLRGTGPAGQ